GVVFLTSLVFSLGGFINAVYARSFDDISIVPTFVLTPLTYLGGVFYSINLLPDFWQGVSLINPILHMVNAFRFGILGVSDINIGIALGLMAVFVVGLYLFSYRLLVRGVGLRNCRPRGWPRGRGRVCLRAHRKETRRCIRQNSRRSARPANTVESIPPLFYTRSRVSRS